MIFLSHNYKDKPVVEQIALKLSAIYGQNNVFYDSWSIQPGQGIIDKMNEGYTTVELIDNARANGWFNIDQKLEFTFDSRPHNSKIVGIEARR